MEQTSFLFMPTRLIKQGQIEHILFTALNASLLQVNKIFYQKLIAHSNLIIEIIT
jgi:hypothetical protein